MPNHLLDEKSPYLLQHADNPVDWYPWGDEAFGKARVEDKPIFLSVGYSTCHWCHVMAHESFESAQIAEVLNRDFVPVKVDREERPDVDRVYMTFVQATTGSGGWPMSVWLTPALEPFYGGTYFPPTSRWGRPGFVEVLSEIARAWRNERPRLVGAARMLTDRLRGLGHVEGDASIPGRETLGRGVEELAEAFDARHGGFGSAPKFPRPAELLFLFREHARAGRAQARDMALATLGAMALGGMRDHLGGGFHRYSVDARWRVPHFEKMLYDQAQLALAYLDGAQASGDRVHLDVARDTLGYVQRDLTHPGGGFYSAEDADSVPPEEAGAPNAHASEGAFYLWTDREIRDRLGPDAETFRLRFGVEPDGNARDDPQGELAGRNILFVARSVEEVAQATGRSLEDVGGALQRSRDTLFAARARRPRPHLDDKVLTAWNGLMIAAFARAARVAAGWDPVLGDEAASYLRSAQRAGRFIRDAMWHAGEGRLMRRYRDEASGVEGYAEDYACLILGLIELFQADGDPAWLEWALALQGQQDARFWDEAAGGWFSTGGQDPSVLLRLKEDYDGAEPAASSVSVWNLLALSHLTGDDRMTERVGRTLALFGRRMREMSRAVPMMLGALSAYHAGIGQIVVVGEDGTPGTIELLTVVNGAWSPFSVLIRMQPGEGRARISRLLPFVAEMTMRNGRATAYVCRNFACTAPTTDASELARQLGPV
jgi:hypothetical protein